MQSTRRSAAPVRVHQFWDATQHVSSGTPVDIERISAFPSFANIPRDELTKELEAAVADGLLVIDESSKKDENPVYKLPDPNLANKGGHDWYCFKCHLPGSVVQCEDCPKVFHLECLPADRKPEKDLFVCPPCHITSTKPSAEKLVNLKQKPLNVMIEYVCARFKEWNVEFLDNADGKIWAQVGLRPAKDAWRFNLLVHDPIDLSVMIQKANSNLYASLDEFQVDCEALVHNIGVYFGPDQLKSQTLGYAFLNDVMHDIGEIKLCHDCFRLSNEKNHYWWFCLPCTTPHEVVWAKQSGYPYWPAKVMKHEGAKYDVRYFGGNYERAIIDVKNVQPIDTPLTTLKVRRTGPWNDAYAELQKFLDIAKNPEKASTLMEQRGPSPAKSKAGKRQSASSANDEVVSKKSKGSGAGKGKQLTPAQKKSQPEPKSGGRNKKVPLAGRRSEPIQSTARKGQANGTVTPAATVTSGIKKRGGGVAKATGSTSSPSRRESLDQSSTQDSNNSRPILLKDENTVKEILDTVDFDENAFLSQNFECPNEGLDSVFARYSDDEADSTQEKVSEDAVSSSCAESKKKRNVQVQANLGTNFLPDHIKKKISEQIASLKEKFAADLSQTKKKQWCFKCEREAIYHCCWNTAYCSLECQKQHWTIEHKRFCRRVRRDLPGSTVAEDDY